MIARVRILRLAARFQPKSLSGCFYEPKEGNAEVRQEHYRDRQEVQGIHRRGTNRDEGAHPRAEGGGAPRPARGQGGRGKRRPREDRRDAGTGARHGQAAPCYHQSKRASPLAETLVRNARIDRKSTRLNSSHSQISYAVFCLKKKKKNTKHRKITSLPNEAPDNMSAMRVRL